MTDPTPLQERLTARVQPDIVDGVLAWRPCVCAENRKPCDYHLGRSDAVEAVFDPAYRAEVLAALGMEQVGVDFCVTHNGVRSEDEEGCDFAHHNDQRCVLTAAFVRLEAPSD